MIRLILAFERDWEINVGLIKQFLPIEMPFSVSLSASLSESVPLANEINRNLTLKLI